MANGKTGSHDGNKVLQDGSVSEMLATHTWGQESVSRASCKKPGLHGPLWSYQLQVDGDRWVPEAHWLSSLAKLVSLIQCETLSQKPGGAGHSAVLL